MSSKKKNRTNKDYNREDVDDESGAKYEDILLITDEKKIRVRCDILVKNSPVFAKVIEAERNRLNIEGTYDDVSEAESYIRSLQQQVKLHEICVPGYRYKDVKMAIALIQADKRNMSEMNADYAFKLLPLAADYSMQKVTRKCEAVLYDELVKLQAKHKKGEVPTNIVFKFLSASDKYSLEKIKPICIDELAAHTDRTSRAELVEEEHVADKTKVTIINRMFESVENHYDRKLIQLQSDTDKRVADITRRREEWVKTVGTWKEDINYELKVVTDDIKEAHQKLLTEEEITRMIEEIKKNVHEFKDKLADTFQDYMNKVRDMQTELIMMLWDRKTDENAKERQRLRAEELVNKMNAAFSKNQIALLGFGKQFREDVTRDLVTCDMSELQKSVSENLALREQFDELSDEVERLRQKILDIELKYEKEKEENDKLREKCRKYVGKHQKINTWIRWAKPVTEDEEKCLCRRHALERLSVKFS